MRRPIEIERRKQSQEKDQPCEDIKKSENKMIQERKRLDYAKIRINGDWTKRGERKGWEKKGKVRKEECGKIKETCFILYKIEWD